MVLHVEPAFSEEENSSLVTFCRFLNPRCIKGLALLMMTRLMEAFYCRDVTFRDVSVRWRLGAVMLKAAFPQLPDPPIANQWDLNIPHDQPDCHRDHGLIV